MEALLEKKASKLIFILILFIFTFITVAGTIIYSKDINVLSFDLDGQSKKAVKHNPIIFDINKQGGINSITTTNYVEITTGYLGGIKNIGSSSLDLMIKAENFHDEIKISSIKPEIYRKSYKGYIYRLAESILPGKSLLFSIKIYYKEDHAKNYSVCSGKINFVNNETSVVIGTIPVKIINSKYPKTLEDASSNENEGGGSPHSDHNFR